MTDNGLLEYGSRRTHFFPDHQHLRQLRHLPGRLDRLPAKAIRGQLPAWPGEPNSYRLSRNRGAAKILAWLGQADGKGWQERWQNSGADTGKEWIDELRAGDLRSQDYKREELRHGLVALLCMRAVLPSYDFLNAYKAFALFSITRSVISPEAFAQVEKAGLGRGMEGRQLNEALNVLAKIVLHTGKDLGEVSAEDLFEIRAWSISHRDRPVNGIHAAWELLIAVGILTTAPTLRAALRAGPRPTAELVDRYRIQCRPIRDMLVRYLDERRPGLDYGSFRSLTAILAGNFWADIERHHPGISTLSLPQDVATTWKERLHDVISADGTRRPRKGRRDVLMHVRAFYLDLQEWALEDPYWVPWAVVSPVRRGDTDGLAKARRSATARMHQRVRERLPHLHVLVDAATQHRNAQARLLELATAPAACRCISPPGCWAGQVSQ